MPKINVSRKKIINVPVEKAYNLLSDMGKWQDWSPWLIAEPEAKVNVRSDNKYYDWTGTRVGEGNMEIVDQVENKSIRYDLNFIKPWKSNAKVEMHTKGVDGGTEIKWSMDSSLPFFMFWMKKMMEGFIGMDYDRGLNMLKDYAEDGKVHSKLNFIGHGKYPGCNYISISRSCSIQEMPKLMEADFTDLMSYTHTVKGFRPQDAFSMYHKWDIPNQKVKYTAGVPYDALPADLPSHYNKGSIPPIKTYTMEHVGPYQHLGNAWSTLYSMHRNKEFKPLKNIHPFETYGNSPKDTDPLDLISRIHFPIR